MGLGFQCRQGVRVLSLPRLLVIIVEIGIMELHIGTTTTASVTSLTVNASLVASVDGNLPASPANFSATP